MSFKNLNLIKPLETAINKEGYTTPTPIQQQAIPFILERRDILGSAQTGTGKTAAFAIPILQLLSNEMKDPKGKRKIKALILVPTRELAVQVGESFFAYGKFTGLKNIVIYGGVSQRPQTEKLKQGVDILVATPGRLLDLINQKYIKLSDVKYLVLDEADRMLDMGFIQDIKKIISMVSDRRQTLFFSATMPKEIVKLAKTILSKPVKIEIAPKVKTVEVIKQAVYFVSNPNKKKLLIHILKNEEVDSALIFTRTKRGADVVTKFLNESKIHASAIHGNKSQNARQRALDNFKLKRTKVLVATDIAARGIDIDSLSHVFNFDIPEFSENYIHRIGRTGRAGLGGTALSFCDSDERYFLKEINKLIVNPIPVIEEHPFQSDDILKGRIKIPAQSYRNSKKSGQTRFSRSSKINSSHTKNSWRRKSKSKNGKKKI